MTEKLRLDIPLVLPDVSHAADACVARLMDELNGRDGIEQVHVTGLQDGGPAQLCVHFDADVLSLRRIRELIVSAGAGQSVGLPDCVEVETAPSPRATVLWLHGLGADGHDFEPVVPELQRHLPVATRFVFPHAPVRPVTVNGGYAMRAWYDILSFDRNAPQDAAGIHRSHQVIAALLAREVSRGVPHERIVLAGFSQGGAMALYSGVRQATPLAGILALSCYLLEPARFDAEREAATLHTPVFLAHGEFDNVLPLALGERARERLEQAGYGVEWHQYRMPHSVMPEEIVHIGRWLARVLAPR